MRLILLGFVCLVGLGEVVGLLDFLDPFLLNSKEPKGQIGRIKEEDGDTQWREHEKELEMEAWRREHGGSLVGWREQQEWGNGRQQPLPPRQPLPQEIGENEEPWRNDVRRPLPQHNSRLPLHRILPPQPQRFPGGRITQNVPAPQYQDGSYPQSQPPRGFVGVKGAPRVAGEEEEEDHLLVQPHPVPLHLVPIQGGTPPLRLENREAPITNSSSSSNHSLGERKVGGAQAEPHHLNPHPMEDKMQMDAHHMIRSPNATESRNATAINATDAASQPKSVNSTRQISPKFHMFHNIFG